MFSYEKLATSFLAVVAAYTADSSRVRTMPTTRVDFLFLFYVHDVGRISENNYGNVAFTDADEKTATTAVNPTRFCVLSARVTTAVTR